MTSDWTFTDQDKRIAGGLQRLLPERLFDAHAHLYRIEDVKLTSQSVWSEGPAEVNVDLWRDHVGKHVGRDRLHGALFLATPLPNRGIERINDFVVEQARSRTRLSGG